VLITQRESYNQFEEWDFFSIFLFCCVLISGIRYLYNKSYLLMLLTNFKRQLE